MPEHAWLFLCNARNLKPSMPSFTNAWQQSVIKESDKHKMDIECSSASNLFGDYYSNLRLTWFHVFIKALCTWIYSTISIALTIKTPDTMKWSIK